MGDTVFNVECAGDAYAAGIEGAEPASVNRLAFNR